MNLLELRRHNTLNVYRQILKGRNTITSIARELNISRLSVSQLTSDLINRGILEKITPKRDMVGRRGYIFSPSFNHYSIFIDKQIDSFCIIGIATNGKVKERFDFSLNQDGHTMQYVFDNFVLPRIRRSQNYKYCTAIYLCGIDIDEIKVDESVKKSSITEIIVKAYADSEKITLFDFNGKYVLSLHSHIYYPNATKEEIYKILPVHDYLAFDGGLYFECFNALQILTAGDLEAII